MFLKKLSRQNKHNHDNTLLRYSTEFQNLTIRRQHLGFVNGGDASLEGPAKASKSGSEKEGSRNIVPRHIPSPKENHCCQVNQPNPPDDQRSRAQAANHFSTGLGQGEA